MQQRFIFFAILIAAIMGIAGFLLINMLLSEPDAPPEEPGLDVGEGEPLGEGVAIPPPGQPAQVGGQTVYLTTDPALAVELAPAAMPPAAPTQTLPGIEATATPGPVAVQPTATPPPIAGAPATAAPPVAPGGEGVNPNVDSFITVDYVVQPGDTLFSIAQAQTSSIEKMAEAGIDADDLVP
ncbi:MAG: LysM peptidoglycan-binding domain-containing protein, partial [Candidatus Promineifilaceae bacterium]|nr:LysM peptidoglycan-binding domain-containing protein [Candidatus Promineifilaceae bacterium]